MMAARPIIHAIDAPGDLVAESGCGLSIPPENPQAIADATLHLMALSLDEREAMGQRGRHYVLAHHDYRILARLFLEEIGTRSIGNSRPKEAHILDLPRSDPWTGIGAK